MRQVLKWRKLKFTKSVKISAAQTSLVLKLVN